MSDNKLKIDVVIADVGESGAVLSDFVTQEIHNTDMAKKADLVNGKVNPTQLPEFSELVGVTDVFSQLEINLRENINISLAESKEYADSIVSEVMSKKADLVNGRVPKEQATNFKDIPGAKAAIDGLKQSLGQEIIGINDSLENNFAKLTNGKVSRAVLPTDLVYSDHLTREMDGVRSSLQNTITQVDEELTALETKTNNKFISKTEAEYFTKDIELKAAIDGLEQKSYTSYASKIVETSKADLTYVNRALGALSSDATKFYPTIALANADIANLQVNQPVQVGEVETGGLWYKATAGATTLTKSPYDPVGLAKADASAKTNINMYRGISAHIPQYNVNTFDKTTLKADYTPTEIRYKGMNVDGGFVIPFNGELRSKLQVWVKVKSATLNAGTNMRFLVQAIKQDNANFLSVYGNIADGAVGWVKLAETALTDANRAVFKYVNIQPQITGGAELVVEDFYIGESNPTTAFVRVPEPKELTIARNAERKNILPHWTKMPAFDGVSYNKNGDITIQSGKVLILDLTVSDLNSVYYCGYLDQANTGDCRFYWTGYPTDLSTVQVRPYFLCSTQGNEFSLSNPFAKTVNRVRLEINNYGTSAINLRSFELCCDPVAVNGKTKIGDRFDESKLKSEIIKTVSSQKPEKNFSAFPDFSVVAKSADGKRYAVSGEVYGELVALGNIKTGKTYYISLPDSVATLGTGTASLTVYHTKADGTSLGGLNANIMPNGVKNVSITTTAETSSLQLRINLTNDAKVELGRLVISEVPYSDDLAFEDLFKEDLTGTMLSDWEYPNLSGFSKHGDQSVEYPITIDAEGDRVLSIPVTNTSEIYGQGAKFIINMPADQSKQVVLSFLAKSQYDTTNPTRIWTRLFREGATAEITANVRNMVINRDGSWTLNQIHIPRVFNGFAVKYVEVFLKTDNTSVVPLQLKRFIQTVGSHNPFVKFIKYASEKTASGLTDYLRLKDALAEQPQNVFSVGRQLFRPIKTVQDTVADYELINGQSLLPKRLNNVRHIDSDGFKILHVDFDDNVYIKKGNALYKTTVDDLNSRCSTTSVVGTENRGIFDSTGLPLVNASTPYGWLRITGDGTLVVVSKEGARYSEDGGATWLTATGYQDVQGIHYNAWGTDCVDNIVITSGYKPATEGRGTGRVNFSSDNGKTYQVILDLATSTFIDDSKRNSMHIHSVKYDPYWEGVWVVMGDGAFNNLGSSVQSNLWFIEKPATPEQSMISFNTRGQDWLNEQHVSIFPLQDCLLLGADANPTALYRMARTKNPNALRDTAMFTHSALSHYGCGGYQHAPHLPATMYFGRDGAYTGTDSPHDIVYMTYDGVNVVEIYKEPVGATLNGEKPNCFAYALDKHFVFDKRTDGRFSSGGTWVVGDIRYMR